MKDELTQLASDLDAVATELDSTDADMGAKVHQCAEQCRRLADQA